MRAYLVVVFQQAPIGRVCAHQIKYMCVRKCKSVLYVFALMYVHAYVHLLNGRWMHAMI